MKTFDTELFLFIATLMFLGFSPIQLNHAPSPISGATEAPVGQGDPAVVLPLAAPFSPVGNTAGAAIIASPAATTPPVADSGGAADVPASVMSPRIFNKKKKTDDVVRWNNCASWESVTEDFAASCCGEECTKKILPKLALQERKINKERSGAERRTFAYSTLSSMYCVATGKWEFRLPSSESPVCQRAWQLFYGFTPSFTYDRKKAVENSEPGDAPNLGGKRIKGVSSSSSSSPSSSSSSAAPDDANDLETPPFQSMRLWFETFCELSDQEPNTAKEKGSIQVDFTDKRDLYDEMVVDITDPEGEAVQPHAVPGCPAFIGMWGSDFPELATREVKPVDP